ncbi:unnamed protein product [Protopolystoma xenopodis]|uniref:Uncharacterized protein n=1 Tax=Protopolystoma xenopodis TaxID=117903 RepID=A0A448XCI2_9PLAT|nr:unnamed protein product [Protopolystoma xenopodis]
MDNVAQFENTAILQELCSTRLNFPYFNAFHTSSVHTPKSLNGNLPNSLKFSSSKVSLTKESSPLRLMPHQFHIFLNVSFFFLTSRQLGLVLLPSQTFTWCTVLGSTPYLMCLRLVDATYIFRKSISYPEPVKNFCVDGEPAVASCRSDFTGCG